MQSYPAYFLAMTDQIECRPDGRGGATIAVTSLGQHLPGVELYTPIDRVRRLHAALEAFLAAYDCRNVPIPAEAVAAIADDDLLPGEFSAVGEVS